MRFVQELSGVKLLAFMATQADHGGIFNRRESIRRDSLQPAER